MAELTKLVVDGLAEVIERRRELLLFVWHRHDYDDEELVEFDSVFKPSRD